MSLFKDIGKALGGVAKGVSKVASVVTKPIGKALKPATNLLRDAAVKATANTPLGGAVAGIAKLDFGKDPVGSIGKATIKNFQGAAELGKGLVAARIGGAVQGAVGSALKDTPLANQGLDTGFGKLASNITSGALGSKTTLSADGTPIMQGGSAARISVQKSMNVRPIGGNSPNARSPAQMQNITGTLSATRGLSTLVGPSGAGTPGADTGSAANPFWREWSGRKEHLGGVIHDGSK